MHVCMYICVYVCVHVCVRKFMYIVHMSMCIYADITIIIYFFGTLSIYTSVYTGSYVYMPIRCTIFLMHIN